MGNGCIVFGFPLPYPQELIYSLVARAGVHDGETSPKQLLDSVFADRKVIATVNLPSHIEEVAAQYPDSLDLTSNRLIARHTLWPLYSPFVSPSRRRAIERWMMQKSYGSVHLASGVAASRIKQKQELHFCPACIEEQIGEHGEAYWDRRWQAPLVKSCEKHGPLCATNIRLSGDHRHAFIPVSEIQDSIELNASLIDKRFTNLVVPLMHCENLDSPTYHQWTLFYRELCQEFYCSLGGRIDHQGIHCLYFKSWKKSWLRESNLMPEGKDTSWLKAIFRKHRKTFSFAEHTTTIEAISGGEVQIIDAINRALSFPSEEPMCKKVAAVFVSPVTEDQRLWVDKVSRRSPKLVRQDNAALYARLYRNHHDWLIRINAKNRASSQHLNNRVDWNERDRETAYRLRKIILRLEDDLSLPRLSKSFLLNQLPNSASIEKNLYRLHRCRLLLRYYSESITDYQVRRLTVAVIAFGKDPKELKRWLLLRQSGLSDQRITDGTGKFLDWLLIQ